MEVATRGKPDGSAMHRLALIRPALVALSLAGCSTVGRADASTETPTAANSAVPVAEASAITPDGVRLYYRVAGDQGEAVIAPFALYLGKALDPLARGRRIVTYDPRGRGRSQAATPDQVSLDHLLIDLDTVRRAVGADQVSIIGWSGGGMETFVYALRNPGRVRRLVQLAPVGPRLAPYGAQMIEDRRARTDAEAAQALSARVEAGDFAADPAAHCRASNAVTVPPLLADPADFRLVPDVCTSPNEHPAELDRYFGALFLSIDGYDWRSALGSVTIPRLVVHALRDNIPLAGSEEWVRGRANARLLLIADSGHFPFLEQPEATLRAIDIFLDGEWPPGARALPAD
jgi:pimeloyl-ACP methyl ester carboxylesterase